VETIIRPLTEGDFADWEPLWQGYLHFYREELDDEVTKTAFSRLVAQADCFGLIALQAGRPGGLVNCIMHASTWTIEPVCYLEDLFVADNARGTGLSRQLIEAAEQEAVRRGAVKLYWHTQAFNGRARSLYDQMAHLQSMVVYERPL
jgi:GNAT superfamily N-acetyltransferase